MFNKIKLKYIIILLITFVFAIIAFGSIQRLENAKRYEFDFDLYKKNGFLVKDDKLIFVPGEDSHINSPRFCLRQGSYMFDVFYQTDIDYQVTVYLDNDMMGSINLPASQSQSSQVFTLGWPTDRAYMSFDIPNEGSVVIDSIVISSEQLMYTDGIFQLIGLILIYVLLIWFVLRIDTLSKKQRIVIAGIAAMIFLVNLPLYLNIHIDDGVIDSVYETLAGVIRFGTDTGAQLMRLQGVMYGFLDGQFPVVIAPNYLRENGELQFLYPNIFLYPFALLRLAGASMPLVFRWFTIVCNVATIFAMYYVCKLLSKDIRLCLIITALYTFEPHRLRVVLTKGAAMGMGIPYIFVPLAIAGLYLIIKKQKRGIWLLAFGVTGVLESHITSVLLLIALLVFGSVFCIKDLFMEKFRGVRWIGISAGLCILMNLGFLTIFLYYYALGLNTDALMWTSISANTLSPLEMITDAESLYYFMGLTIAVLLLVLTNERGHVFKFALSMVIFSLMLWIMTSDFFPYDAIAEVFSPMRAFMGYMQKPHRFYTVMAGGLLIAVLVLAVNLSRKKIRILLGVFGIIVLLTTIVEYRKYMNVGWRFYDELSGDINIVMTGDYLPLGVDSEAEFSGTGSLSDEDSVESLYYKKLGTTVDYHYVTDKDGIYAEFPLLTYDGYVGVDETGTPVEIIKGEDARIRVNLKGDGKEHGVHIEFVVKPVFKLLYSSSLIFSIISVCLYIAISAKGLF